MLPKFEDPTSKAVEKGSFTAKAKEKRLRKVRQSDGERRNSETSSVSESKLEEQVKQRNKKQKIKIKSSRAKADECKKCQKGSRGESEHEYNDKVRI